FFSSRERRNDGSRYYGKRLPATRVRPHEELAPMETSQVARVLDEMGTLLEVRGENPFRCRAYHAAAQALRSLPSDLAPLIDEGRLAEVPGIGETMLAKITRLVTTGNLPEYEKLRRETPPGLVALLRVPGLGPKKIKQLHDELKIESLADLRKAAE